MPEIQSLSDVIAGHARQYPDQVALIAGGQPVSFAELDRLGDAAAGWLVRQGIGAGDRVAVWMVNRPEWLALLIGAQRVGAALVAVNTRYRTAELAHILAGSGARLLVLQERFRKIDFLDELRELDPASVPELRTIALADCTDMPARILDLPVVPLDLTAIAPRASPNAGSGEQLAILFTTSGTTKLPKLVMHSRNSLGLHSRNLVNAMGFGEPDAVVLAALPFCGVFGLCPVLAALTGGRPVVVMEAFDAEQAASDIREFDVTHLFGSDELFRRLLDVEAVPGALGSLRWCGFASFNTGADELISQARAHGIPMVGLYGSSEVQSLFSIQSRDLSPVERARGGGVPASPDARLRIRDLETGALLGPGESGMIEIRSPANFMGYLNNPEATAEAVDSEGYFRTGDVGYLRGDGSFVYQTRQGDAIRLAGFLVNPAEIEDVMRGCPGVAEAQVVGLDIEGEPGCVAFVIPAPGQNLTEEDVLSWMASEIARFKLPRRVWLVDSFPVTQSANGTKIQRVQLRQMAVERLAVS